MGLLDRCARVRTSAELEAAAESRLWDGMTLAMGNEPRPLAAIYLLGYVAEFVLTVAYCRAKPGKVDDVDAQRAAMANKYTDQYQKAYGCRKRNDHELAYLLFALERERIADGRALDAALVGALRVKINWIASNWNERLRYRDVRPTQNELWEMVKSVNWVFEARRNLWS